MQNHDDIFSSEKPKRKPTRRILPVWIIVGIVLVAVSSLVIAFLNKPTLHDFVGNWDGLLYQGNGGYSPAYHFQLVIYPGDNNQVSGIAEISIGDSSRNNVNGIDDTYSGVMRFTGELRDSILHISEQSVIENDVMMGWEWCIKDYQLTVNGDILSGEWQAPRTPGCAPGTIVLERQPDNGY